MKTESNGKDMTNKRYANIKEVSEYTSLLTKTIYEFKDKQGVLRYCLRNRLNTYRSHGVVE